MRDHTYKRRALDTTRKDDAGRNSIYQRLVNRLVHVPGGGQRCSEVGKAEGDGDGEVAMAIGDVTLTTAKRKSETPIYRGNS